MYFCAATGEQAWTGEKKRRRTNEEREWKKGRFICTARLAGGLARGSVFITVRYGTDHGVLGNVFFIIIIIIILCILVFQLQLQYTAISNTHHGHPDDMCNGVSLVTSQPATGIESPWAVLRFF